MDFTLISTAPCICSNRFLQMASVTCREQPAGLCPVKVEARRGQFLFEYHNSKDGRGAKRGALGRRVREIAGAATAGVATPNARQSFDETPRSARCSCRWRDLDGIGFASPIGIPLRVEFLRRRGQESLLYNRNRCPRFTARHERCFFQKSHSLASAFLPFCFLL